MTTGGKEIQETRRLGPPPVEQVEANDPFGLRILSFRRYSVRHMSMLLTATALSACVTGLSITAQHWLIAIISTVAFAITAFVLALIMRATYRRTFVEQWIRRLGMGDFEYTVSPWGDDELSKCCVALETLRQRAIEAMQLNRVRQLSEELQQKNQDLEEAIAEIQRSQDQIISQQKLAELGALSSGIAHEIANPLQFTRNFSTDALQLASELREVVEPLLKSADLELAETIRELCDGLGYDIKRVLGNTERATRIIQAVQQLNRPSSGKFFPTDVNHLLTRYTQIAYSTAMANQENMELDIQYRLAENPEPVPVVAEDIARVINHMVSNACHATRMRAASEAEDYTPTLVLTTKQNEKEFKITFQDNGCGIPADTLDKIFVPFYTNKEANKGVGLGLSLSHDIIRQHGGNIRAESEAGNGARFTVTIPNSRRNGATEEGAVIA